MKLEFYPPVGADIDDADIEDVVGHVLGSDEDFWNSGSGDGLLIRGSGAERSVMHIYFLGDGLFQLAHSANKRAPSAALSRSPPDEPEYVRIGVGGEPKTFNIAQAIGREEAVEILRFFAATGDQSPGHQWERVDWPE